MRCLPKQTNGHAVVEPGHATQRCPSGGLLASQSSAAVKKIVSLIVGVITSIGGFVEAGSISTATQAGAEFGFSLLWAIAIATLILALLAEMAGRVAALSQRSMAAAVRERFGFHYSLVPLGAEMIIDLLLLTAELGGVAIAAMLLTQIGFQWWVLPGALVVWLVLWKGHFSVIEDGVGLLGMITLVFVVSAWQLRPDAAAVLSGFVPTLPGSDLARYGFLTVSIIGATVSPYLLNFYSSAAIEEKWHESDLPINRITTYCGMGFGSIVSMGVLVTSAIVLPNLDVESYEQASQMLVPAFGTWAVTLFALALGVGCFGAAIEIALTTGYVVAQTFGWPWGADKKRRETSRFTAAFTLVLLVATGLGVSGLDPLKVTLFSVALTVVIMPIIVLPFLVLMNDERYVKNHTSGALGNGLLAALTILGAIMAIIVLPLQILGG
jgi:Mn2+/Fe2+ NRAMP family transporter